MSKVLLFFAAAILFTSCVKSGAEEVRKYYNDYELISKTLNIPASPSDYSLKTPNYISVGFFAPSVLNGEATLGRVLFYDKSLSKDGKVSCASCHDQKLGFADSKAFSDGSNGKVTTRNSLALGSVLNFSVYYGDERYGRVPFFWDNSATTVQEQAERTLANPNEMDMKMSEVYSRVKGKDYYKEIFDAVFPNDGSITEERILNSISAFVNAIPSYNTKFDASLESHFTTYQSTQNLSNYDFPAFSEQENRGMDLYVQKCASCHGEAIGSPTKTRANNGLAVQYQDEGIGKNSGASADMGMFKVPTLRNILLTAPYMHDGSLATIDDVLNHYNNGIKMHKNLDPNLVSNGSPKKMNFSEKDKEDIKAFFATLTDYELMDDPRFSDPFKK